MFRGGYFTDANYHQITIDDALEIILRQDEVICKPSQESGSGRNIEFWKTAEMKQHINDFLHNNNNTNYLVQKILTQHEELARIHAESINTIRTCSILMSDGVHILSSVLRMGVEHSRVDNATAGGITCGINPDGTLQEFAYSYYSGKKYIKHPQGYIFKGKTVPSYEKIIQLIKEAHQLLGNFRLVSWDIAVDQNGEPVLIEANMRKGSINFHQFSNGPMFGELTDQVLNEVFNKKE